MSSAEKILYDAYLARKIRARINPHFRPDHRTRTCPGCETPLHLRAVNNTTILTCPRCGWFGNLNYLLDEARLPGEHISPKPPTIKVFMSPDGKKVRGIG